MDSSIYSHRKLSEVHLWKCPPKSSENLKKPPNQTKSARVKPKDLVTLKRGHLNLFRYPTWGIGTYLGRGVGGANFSELWSWGLAPSCSGAGEQQSDKSWAVSWSSKDWAALLIEQRVEKRAQHWDGKSHTLVSRLGKKVLRRIKNQPLCFNKRNFTECNGQKIEEETDIGGCW